MYAARRLSYYNRKTGPGKNFVGAIDFSIALWYNYCTFNNFMASCKISFPSTRSVA